MRYPGDVKGESTMSSNKMDPNYEDTSTPILAAATIGEDITPMIVSIDEPADEGIHHHHETSPLITHHHDGTPQ